VVPVVVAEIPGWGRLWFRARALCLSRSGAAAHGRRTDVDCYL